MKKHILFFVSIISIILFSSCSEDKRINAELDNIENILSINPDSALLLCKKLEERNLVFSYAQKMRYELLHSEVQNKTYNIFTTDSILKDVVAYYDQNGTTLEKMRAYYMLGCAYRDMGEAPLAIDAYNTATPSEDENNSELEKRLVSSIYSQMASLYHQQLLLSEEIEVREKSIRLSTLLCDTLNMACDYCRMAGAYCLQNEYTKAEDALEKGRDLYIEAGHLEIWMLFSPMLIDIYLKQNGNLGTAKHLIDKYEATFCKTNEGGLLPENQRQFYSLKAKYYELTGKLDSAEICYRWTERPNMTYSQKDPMYRGLLQVYQKKNITDSIAKYAQLYCEANDSSIALQDREQVGRMAAAYKYSRYQREAGIQSKIASERKQQLLLVLSASIIILLCLTFVNVYLRRRRKERLAEISRLTQELEDTEKAYEEEIQHLSMLEQTHQKVNEVVRMELEASKAEADHRQVLYEESQKEVVEINRHYSELMDVHRQEVERLKHKIENLSKQGGISVNVTRKSDFISQPIIQKVFRLTQTPLDALSNSEWEQLIKVYSEYYPELVHDLQQNPQMTKQCIHACLLFALNLRSGDIANILKLNIQRVSNLKSDINAALFNDHSAKNLINNLKQKYDLYIGI